MTQNHNVSVSMNQAAAVKTGMVFKQGDFGFNLVITVLDFDATGTTPQIVFRKPMGAVESTTITVSSNTYTYTMQGTELDTPGKVFCDLKLKNSTTQRISTASFMFEVVADTLDGLNEHANSYSDTIGQIWQTLQDYSEDSEAWAKGTRGGTPVPSTAEQYQNNAKYYADICAEETGELSNTVEQLAADVDEISENTESISTDLYDTIEVVNSKNLLDIEAVLANTTISTASNTSITATEASNNYDLSGIINVEANQTYYFKGHSNTSYKPHIMVYKEGYQKAHGDMTLYDSANSIWSYNVSTYGTQVRIRYSNSCDMDTIQYWFGKSTDWDGTVYPVGYKSISIKDDVIIPQTESEDFYYKKFHGKKILNYGDSIAAGAGNNGKGYAHMIAETYGMTVEDRAASGSSIHSISGRGRIVGRITGDSVYAGIDYVFVEGGYNDLNDSGDSWLGSLSNDYTMPEQGTFEDYFANSLDAAFCKLKTNYPAADIIYIITPKLRSSYQPIWDGTTLNFNALRDVIIKACQKWSVEYVDLFTESPFNSGLTQYYAYTLSDDGIHPTADGYNYFYIPWILKTMR